LVLCLIALASNRNRLHNGNAWFLAGPPTPVRR
jgi:hypothetical protein